MYWNFGSVVVEPQRSLLPLDWQSLAPSREILVEIGFGNGEHLEYLASKYPDDLVVGIEVSQWCLSKAARRALQGHFTNIRLIHGDARYLLDRCFQHGSISRLFMNFPCPWPKTKHATRRVTSPHFAALLARVLKVGGTFELATDVDWYAAETKNAFGKNSSFEVGEVLVNPLRECVTKYERKWKSMGKDTFAVIAQKCTEVPRADRVEEAWEMSVETARHGEIGVILDQLRDKEIAGRDFRGFFRDVFIGEDGTALIRVIALDEGFEQHFFIRIMPTQHGIQAKVDTVGLPYRTPGVRACFKEVLNLLGLEENASDGFSLE